MLAVLPEYRGTPIESLLLAQNLGQPFETPEQPCLVVATCIDPRINLQMPPGTAFVIRTAGVNLKGEGLFQLPFLTSVMGISHVALIAHDDCATVVLRSKRQAFVDGQTANTGSEAGVAEALFDQHADFWHVPDEVAVLKTHAQEARDLCGDVVVAPLYYRVKDHRLLQVPL